MSSVFQVISFLFEQVGQGVLLIYLYGIFARKEVTKTQLELSIGTVFGIAAILSMADPIHMTDGVIIDLRNLFVGTAAAFFGWRGGAMSALIAIAMRSSIGGTGAITGISGILIAMAMGLLSTYYVQPRIKTPILSYQILAAMISTHILSGLLLPADLIARFFTQLGPILFIGNLVGSTVIGLLIRREMALVGETKRLSVAAMTDPLTKILNRRSAIETYEQMLHKPRPKRGVAMSCIDLDKFKKINDTYGHLAGDQVLQEVAGRLSTCLRPADIFCRMGGDEFVIVLVNVSSDEALSISERCSSIISRVPIACDEANITASISVGSVWSPVPLHFEEFRGMAGEALYHAKKDNLNRTAFSTAYYASSVAAG
ncbi:MAG: diguanylate cyclase [Yoonia sp.]|nr:diguanylate cyclase [Yoonia sp.]